MIKRFIYTRRNYNATFSDFRFATFNYMYDDYSHILNNVTFLGHINISEFYSNDLINKAYFVFPISRPSSKITFKLFESNYYNFLDYPQIDISDLIDSGTVYDYITCDYNSTSEEFLFLQFDITALIQKSIDNNQEYVNFRITNNTTTDETGYSPETFELDTPFCFGFYEVKDALIDEKRIDSLEIGSALAIIDIKNRNLKVDLPTISTEENGIDITFGCCIKSFLSLFGNRKYNFNYEYSIKQINDRIILQNYKDEKRYFELMTASDIYDEYGIEVFNSVYFNLNDTTYIDITNDYIELCSLSGQKIVFNKITLDDSFNSLKIHHIEMGSNIFSYNWTNNLLSSVTKGNRVLFTYQYNSNNLISKVYSHNNKKLIKLSYNNDSTPKIISLKMYKASTINEDNEDNIIVNDSFEYNLLGNLNKITDNITTQYVSFSYLVNDVTGLSHNLGVGDEISYDYSLLNSESTITNRYGEYKKIKYNYFDDVIASYNSFGDYSTIEYQKTLNNVRFFTQEVKSHKKANDIVNGNFINSNNNVPSNWYGDHIDQIGTTENNYQIDYIIGSKVYKFFSTDGETKKIHQSIPKSGLPNDCFFVGAWVKGYFSTHQNIKLTLRFMDGEIIASKKSVIASDLFDQYHYISGIIKADKAYSVIVLEIEYNGFNECYVGNIQAYKISSGDEYIYGNEGRIDSFKSYDDAIEYSYNSKNLVDRVISNNGNVLKYQYNSINQLTIAEDISGSKKIIKTYDDLGNEASTTLLNNNGKEIETETEYDDKSNLVVEKDERDFYTFNTYNNYNELIHSVYPSGLARKLEYGSYGNISKSLFMLNDKKDGASFTYDAKNRLKGILIQNNTKYEYTYDSNNRKSSFSFINGNNNEAIISYGYNKLINNKATDLITEKKYFNSNSDKYNFTYNDKRQLTNIKYSGINRFIFSYDESDRLSYVNDVYNDLNTYLTYDNNDNIICREIHEVHDDEIFKEENHYDNDGNIQSNVITCDGKKRSYDYDYINEYSEYNLSSYLSRLSTFSLNDYVLSADSRSMYGAVAYSSNFYNYYDNLIKRNIFRFNSSNSVIAYETEFFNKSRVDGKDYGHVKYDKQDWDDKFTNQKCAVGWFRFSGSLNNRIIYSFRMDTSHLYKLLIRENVNDNNLYLCIQKGENFIMTNLEISSNEWSLIGVSLKSNKIIVSLNGVSEEINNNTDNISLIKYIIINGNTDSNNITDLIYLSIGPYFNYNFDIVYNDGIRYLSGYSVNKMSAVMYYNHKVYEACDVIPLNGSFISRDGLKPVNYIFTNPAFTKDKTKLFMYDEETRHHVYASYGSYKTYCGETHSALAYQFSYGTSGTLSMWFKLDSGTYTENRYIFSIQKSSTFNEVISCYIGTDNKLYVSSPNNSTYSYNISNPLSWNFVSIIWSPGTLKIGLNGNLSSVAINSSINATNSRTFIGHKMELNNEAVNHLEGKIQLISYKDDAITDDELFDIEDYGYLIDVRKEYDNDDRLIKRSINTLDNSLNTTYAYFEDVNSNKLNKLPSNEIDYNNIKTIYAYDEDGNIIEKRVLNGNTIKEKYLYEYNELKELKKETHYRENNQFDYSYEYDYNINGNRTKVTSYDETESILSEDEYTYSNIYKDRLESVTHNNTSLYTFSYQGSNFLNPSIMTKNNNTKFLSWHGRRLTSIGSTSFNYNESGIRIRKDNTNDETSYYINSNNKVLRSNFIDINHNNYIIDYHYDKSGSLIGFNFDGKEYFYKKDILGIINEIIDEEGTPYVYYKYTAFGIPTCTINTNLSSSNQQIANILLNHNIYIYKDYIYDRDIELYYLNSRYYDPYIGRFISTDAIEYLDFEIVNGLNLYAYCSNNPVMYSDPDGTSVLLWALLITAVFIVSGAVVGGISAGMSGGDAIDILEGIGKGATNGLIIGGAFSLIAGGFVIGSETSIGSLMISYGISVSSNMLEVGVIQGKKSYYEGDGFWDVANDINKAMFSNSGSILIGKPFLFSKPLYGTRVISKVPTIANIFLSFEVEKMFADVSFFTTTKATLLSQASPLGLYISYGIATHQIIKLLRAIAEKPDFNNSKWVLY